MSFEPNIKTLCTENHVYVDINYEDTRSKHSGARVAYSSLDYKHVNHPDILV